MLSIFKTPKAPNPAATAAAQSGINQDAAVSSQLVNAIDQNTPDGGLTYSQNGDWTFVGADGKTKTIPKLTATQTLNAVQQEAKNYEQIADRDTNKLGVSLIGNAQGVLGQPTDYSEASIRRKTDAMINPRLEERFGRDRAALETAMINRGIRQGGQAYTDALGDFEKGRNDAYTSEGLSNRQQALTELGMPQRDAINNISALLGTGQVAAPQFTNTPQANIGAPDYIGLVNQKYQAKVANRQAMLGGLFGLGGAALGAF